MIPASAARTPETAYTAIFIRSTLTPESQATVLIAADSVDIAAEPRLSQGHPAGREHDRRGDDRDRYSEHVSFAERAERGGGRRASLESIGVPLVKTRTAPRNTVMLTRVAMNGCTTPKVIARPDRAPRPAPNSSASGMVDGQTIAAGYQTAATAP